MPNLAHLAFCAAAILVRPSALIFLRLGSGASSLGANPRFKGQCDLSTMLAPQATSPSAIESWLSMKSAGTLTTQ
jgi:hypothetical protein